jgi:hypothetical protein
MNGSLKQEVQRLEHEKQQLENILKLHEPLCTKRAQPLPPCPYQGNFVSLTNTYNHLELHFNLAFTCRTIPAHRWIWGETTSHTILIFLTFPVSLWSKSNCRLHLRRKYFHLLMQEPSVILLHFRTFMSTHRIIFQAWDRLTRPSTGILTTTIPTHTALHCDTIWGHALQTLVQFVTWWLFL